MSNVKDFDSDDAHGILRKMMKCELHKTVCDNRCERCGYRTDADELIALAEYATKRGDIVGMLDNARRALKDAESFLDIAGSLLDALVPTPQPHETSSIKKKDKKQ